MKKLKFIITGLFVITLSLGVLAQSDGPPLPPGDHGSTDDQPVGGTAPIGAGTILLLGLGAIYGSKRVYDLRKKS
jgi:hypothetical protein